MAPSEVEVRLHEAALAIRKEHYKDLTERWRAIETKAQGAIATTGILIAGILAFVRDLEAQASKLERALLAVLLIASVLSLILGVMALWVRSVSEAPFAVSVDPLIAGFVKDPSQLDEQHWRDVVREQANVWGRTNAKLHRANQAKARLILSAQVSLALAAILAVGFCLIRILGPSSGMGAP